MLTPLIYTPSPKRGRGEEGVWTPERTRNTPVSVCSTKVPAGFVMRETGATWTGGIGLLIVIGGSLPTNPGAEMPPKEKGNKKEKETDDTEEEMKAGEDDEKKKQRISEMSSACPGSPSLKPGPNMGNNITTKGLMLRHRPEGMRGMPRSLKKALFSGGQVEIREGAAKELKKTTFVTDMTQRMASQLTSKGGAEGQAKNGEEEKKEGGGKEE